MREPAAPGAGGPAAPAAQADEPLQHALPEEQDAAPHPGYYNPAPVSPTPARLIIQPGTDADGTPRLNARVEVQEGGASSLSSVATLCNSAVGAGVLSLPFAFRCAGLAGGLLLCLLVAVAESFSLYVLSKFAERYDAPSYGSLVRRALGRKTASSLSAIMLLYLVGSCIAYLVIIGDTFSALAQQAFGIGAYTDRQPILLGVGLLVILPMCFARSLAALEWVSAGAVAGFLYTSAAVLLRGSQVVAARTNPWAGILLWQPDLRQALYSVSILVFGFNSSANAISIFSELDSYPHRLVVLLPPSPMQYASLRPLAPRPRTHKLIGMLGVILVAMTLIAAGYIVVGAAGYAAFPGTVSSNLLNTFPQDDAVMQVARAVIGLMVTGHYPLAFVPARVAFADLLHSLFDVERPPHWMEVAFTLVFVGGSLGTALVITDLGSVLHLIGGTAACFMVFLLPGLLCWNGAVIKATASTLNLDALAEGEEGGSDGLASADGAGAGPSAPLLYAKKAGLRTHGVLFVSESRMWWAGLGLLVLAGLVFVITLVTAGGGAE
ncbi:hypothetical protein Rsub_12813 [Raphidocelis subcapitata]|uniref:Amino acid transporter transmembrane domain-containing protein n=1 Tax=Raphidocelis subcapitata TaxID=307507 RepID=A0A2V0PRJ7_9CHLO|nr:hypothetical protein Rsub_12813 [Raphidocelis subcapitata]|eukprot:GBF99905.1 hypothetical protein Rsub_12813 [Raphidocelis subcapitata]